MGLVFSVLIGPKSCWILFWAFHNCLRLCDFEALGPRFHRSNWAQKLLDHKFLGFLFPMGFSKSVRALALGPRIFGLFIFYGLFKMGLGFWISKLLGLKVNGPHIFWAFIFYGLGLLNFEALGPRCH